jgi:hypothetical protein
MGDKTTLDQAFRVLAVLNSFLLALLDFLEVSNVPSQVRLFDAYPDNRSPLAGYSADFSKTLKLICFS